QNHAQIIVAVDIADEIIMDFSLNERNNTSIEVLEPCIVIVLSELIHFIEVDLILVLVFLPDHLCIHGSLVRIWYSICESQAIQIVVIQYMYQLYRALSFYIIHRLKPSTHWDQILP